MKFLYVIAAVAALATTEAAAQDKGRVPVTASVTAQKAEFVTNLVTNSASIRAIEESNDAEAKAKLAKARELVADAKKDIAAGKVEQADQKLNEATALVMNQTRRVSEHEVKQDSAKQLYEQRRATVKAMLEAYDRVSQEKTATAAANQKRGVVQTKLAEAEALAGQSQFDKAVSVLDAAYASIAGEVATLRDGDKLVKELKFASAEEEYHYEIDRNDSHFFLLKLTLAEKQPDPMIATQAEKMRVQAQELRDQAQAQAAGKKHKEAIKLLNDATDILIKAMRMSGAYIPG